jgi:8-amino-7-oxononanoate synthase
VLASLANQLASDLESLRRADRLRSCPAVAGSSRIQVTLDGNDLLSFCSNDYLGLACHPNLQKAASAAIARSGLGAGSARLVAGNLPDHRSLERTIATLVRLPSALLFPTGYQANLGVLTALAGPQDLIVADRAVHASLIDGCRLSRAKLALYPHLDLGVAENHLQRLGPKARRRILVTESLFSMDGDIAPLSELASISTAYDAALLVDEAHSIGTFGPSGAGLCAQQGVIPDILVGTLGKAVGASGAFAAGTGDLCHYLVNRARSFIFTTALPPCIAASAEAAIHIISSSEGDDRRILLRALITHLRTKLSLPPNQTPSPILPVILGSDSAAVLASAYLRNKGFLVPAFRPPTVRDGTSRLRITLSALHKLEDVSSLADALLSCLRT